MLQKLPLLLEQSRAAIVARAQKDDAIVQGFFRFHLDELPDSLPEAVRTETTYTALAQALKPRGVAIHARKETAFQLVLDFTMGSDHSDELLAVKFRPNGSIDQIHHES